MNGYLIAVTVPGAEPDTRPIRELWAVTVGDEYDALAEAVTVSGGVHPEIVLSLNEQTLAGLNVVESGKAVRVQAIA